MITLAKVKGSTGDLLEGLLRARGLELGTTNPQGIVSYGRTIDSTLPTLNANAGRVNKFEELTALCAAGVRVPPFAQDGKGLTFPILGRKFQHSKGRDIIPILQNDIEFQWRLEGHASDYFVQYIPRTTEYRVWSYRRRILAVYEKVMKYPERYTKVGCNFQNGFAFTFVATPHEELTKLGAAAVHAMNLDFGAVDILHGQDGNFYVLEVNTAPGVKGERTCITGLADKIVKWVQLGMPKRAL